MNAPLPATPRSRARPAAGGARASMLDGVEGPLRRPLLRRALAVREQHGRDESPFDAPPPEAVVFCESTDDVAAVVKLADRTRVPVIPFGAGTSLEGHVLAVQGGVSIDLSRMNRVLAVQRRGPDRDGAGRRDAHAAQPTSSRDTGLFFPIDPGADATHRRHGATRATGTNAVRYGTMRENVLGLTVVLAERRGHSHRHARAQVVAPATTSRA